mmetsp:Transcript_17142/g.41103  ORF Transcript_17142/g.41103 Transcript_17142/m.41103 type:complete len:236 (-) Transcript_17142:1375-2082(-)
MSSDNWPNVCGIVSFNSFSPRSNNFRPVRSPSHLGMDPVNDAPLRDNSDSCVMLYIHSGTTPASKSFLPRNKMSSLSSSPTSGGIFSRNRLLDRSNVVKFFRLPMPGGIGPVMLFVCKDKNPSLLDETLDMTSAGSVPARSFMLISNTSNRGRSKKCPGTVPAKEQLLTSRWTKSFSSARKASSTVSLNALSSKYTWVRSVMRESTSRTLPPKAQSSRNNFCNFVNLANDDGSVP